MDLGCQHKKAEARKGPQEVKPYRVGPPPQPQNSGTHGPQSEPQPHPPVGNWTYKRGRIRHGQPLAQGEQPPEIVGVG